MRFAVAWALVLFFLAGPVLADQPSVAIAIKGRAFVPSELEIPAGTKVKLVIRNQDEMPAEFESSQLHREKVVPGGGVIVLFVGPLAAGKYEFFNDFHPASRGHLIAK